MTEPQRGSRIGVLRPLRHRDFRLLAAGSLVSLLGDGVFRVTIAVQVFAIYEDPRPLAIVAALWAASQVVALPFGGWAADRIDRRLLAIGADLVRAVALGIVAFLSIDGSIQLWHLYVGGAAVGFSNGFFNPAASSLVPQLVPTRELEQANGFLGVARPSALFIVGPLLGAAIVGGWGPGVALAFDAATFVVSAAFLAFLTARPVANEPRDAGPIRGLVIDLAEGFRYVSHKRWAWTWIVAAGVSTLAYSGTFEVVLPTLLRTDFGLDDGGVARVLGFVFAAGGIGSVLASTIVGQVGLPRRFIRGLFLAEGGALVVAAGYGLLGGPFQAVAIGAVVFTLFTFTEIAGNTLLQTLVPPRLLGRVSSLDWMTSVGLAPVGFVLAAPLVVAVGARTTALVLCLGAAAIIFGLMFVPGMRDIERRGRLADQTWDDVQRAQAPVSGNPAEPAAAPSAGGPGVAQAPQPAADSDPSITSDPMIVSDPTTSSTPREHSQEG